MFPGGVGSGGGDGLNGSWGNTNEPVSFDGFVSWPDSWRIVFVAWWVEPFWFPLVVWARFVLDRALFFCEVDVLFVFPEPDFSLCTSRFSPSISLIAMLKSAVSSDASLVNTLAISSSAFFVLVGEAGMTMLFFYG